MRANAESCKQQPYDTRTILLHWSTAALLVFMWCGAHAIDWFPKGPPRVDARSVHIVVGGLMAVLVGYRIVWRSTKGVRIAEPRSLVTDAARTVHVLLYGLIIATIGLGIFNAWVRGDSLFDLARIPPYAGLGGDARHALSERIVGFHALAANAILVIAAGHAMLALFHHFVRGDGLLARMWRR